MHTLKWFKNRIGKRVYRNDVSCDCTDCKNVTVGGLIISDDQHAEYLYMIQGELNLQYRDEA